ncbi:hypothetical protein SCLCIDRAFT_580662 [Scleroderma citrinum Foug A]|uniref:Major facilitator superfamily (MFS) profile domain-containing protein n=1 Tax=Scleroderma citrinum Foug A TaxID=1036808 RepID=A0A0C3D6X9_9AGAM|nr:hypothetical protein SCLCIDRAFT_580662 [Scleroderma citrinum Foug A]
MSPTASTYRLLDDIEISTDADKRKEVEKILLWKLDLRVFFLTLVSIMNLVDRNNIAAAQLKGLEEDLHMTGQQFNTLVSIMFVGYTCTQVPSNVLLERLRKPSVYLSYCVFLWGIICVSIGL